MDPKIFVGVVVAGFAIVIGIIAFAGPSVISDVSPDGIFPSSSETPTEVLPLKVELQDIKIVELSDKFVVLEIDFLVTNPNYKSVILQFLKYQLFEKDLRVHAGEIGDRPEGFVMGSNYFTILSETPTTLSDEITIRNTGNTPEFWSALENDTHEWRVTGEASFNLSSITSGGENEIFFEFTK